MNTTELQAQLTEILASEFAIPVEEISADATFEGLGLDSLDLVEVTMIVDERIGVKLEDEDLESITTVGDAVDAISEKLGVSA